MPSRSSTSSTRRRIAAGAMPRFSIAYASSSSTVSVTKPRARALPTTPTRSASSRGGCVAVEMPSTVTAPEQGAAREVGNEAVDRAEQRRLARAGLPDDEEELALVDGEVHVDERGRGGARIGEGDVVEGDHASSAGSGGVANAGHGGHQDAGSGQQRAVSARAAG